MNPYIPKAFPFDPDHKGHFGKFGGRYVPETLMPILLELDEFYKTIRFEEAFWDEVYELSEHYVGRPSPLYHAKKLSAELDATILLKREDLNHTGAHKINNTIVQGLMAKRMGKTKIIAETGAGQHGVASATVAALMGLECEVFMGAKDVERQKLNVFRMKLLGAKVHAVESGSSTLKDAMNDAIRHWVTNARDTFYIIGTAAGPHPYPLMVRDFQAIISDEAKKQLVAQKFDMPDYVLACIGGGSNALGMFAHFIEEEKTQCIGIEAGGRGLESGEHGASLALGKPGVLHGQLSYLLQSDEGQVEEAYSISAGLDYPGIGPEHSYLMEEGKVRYDNVTDDEAMDAFVWLSRAEGIVPAFESAHAIAYLKKIPKEELQGKTVVISLSGRGDKDMIQAMDILKDRL
ncbi:MAG: Tryptophan synthase beta chain (EC [uncultured Sulfurovum sp.]|uniref:Tryptophan synthase beta chain n=1 Tax=uncultured Sulfurovum sp. TaxID=269237 RepID=A0A6S6UAA6_9BACT|nr:MAG: Tryptophan synthase beta chain (EC [uncultured Sulfurovum sp.]